MKVTAAIQTTEARRRKTFFALTILYGPLFLLLFDLGRIFGSTVSASLWYPPAGLRFSFLLLFGGRLTPILATIEPIVLVAYNMIMQPASTTPMFLLQSAFVPLLYGLTLTVFRRRTSFSRHLRRVRDVLQLLGAALLTPLIAMLVVRAFALVLGSLEPARYLHSVAIFWVGDVIGILMITPIVLVLLRRRDPDAASRRSLLPERLSSRLIFDFFLIWAVLWLFHGTPFDFDPATRHILWSLTLLPILWISFRDGLTGAIVACVSLTAGTSWLLRLRPDSTSVFQLQVLIILLSVTALLVGAISSELRSFHRRLIRQNRGLRKARQRLRSHRALVERRNEDLEGFFYSVSHDLKSPLFTVEGYLGHLAKDFRRGDADRFDQDLDRIRGAVERLRNMLDGILAAVRADDGTRERVDLARTARQAADQLERRLDERGVRVDIVDDLPIVEGHPVRLLQVFQNLMENAIKFMGDEPDPRIEIGTTGGEIFVRDNGIGIDESARGKIFEIFAQIDRKRGGTGLGLALVRRIVEEHGGEIRVESEGEGLGSTFFFRLG